MAKDPEKMGSVLGMLEEEGPLKFPENEGDGPGLDKMEDLPPFQNMNQMIGTIMQLQANVNNLLEQNQNLQAQIAAMEAGGPPAGPPPWAPLGMALGAIHGVGIPPPMINLDAGSIGAMIMQAMPAPLPPMARGPTANKLEPFDRKMENIKSFIRRSSTRNSPCNAYTSCGYCHT